MFCSNCGAETSKKLCTSCGVKQDKSHKYCKWCGVELSENASICVQCKHKVKENKFVKMLVSLFDIIATIVFACVIVSPFVNYFGCGAIIGGSLLLFFGVVGLFVSLPFVRKLYSKKIKFISNALIRVVIIAVLFVIIYEFVYPYANNCVATVESQTQYGEAVEMLETDPLTAKEMFLALGDYNDSPEKAVEANNYIYAKLGEKIIADFVSKEELSAVEEYVAALPGDFSDSFDYIKEFKYKKVVWLLANEFYAMARRVYSDIPGYKDVDQLMNISVYKLMGNRYVCSKSVSLYSDVYMQVQLLRFNDDINYSLVATYTLSNSTLTGVLGGDFGLDDDITIDYRCYEQNGKIFVGDKQLTNLQSNNGIIVSFVYDGNLFNLAE